MQGALFLCGQHILENLTLHVPCDCKTTTERVDAACYRKYLLHTHVSCKSVLKKALRIPAWCCYYALAGAKINAKVTLSCILPLLSSCSWEDNSPCCAHCPRTTCILTFRYFTNMPVCRTFTTRSRNFIQATCFFTQ